MLLAAAFIPSQYAHKWLHVPALFQAPGTHQCAKADDSFPRDAHMLAGRQTISKRNESVSHTVYQVGSSRGKRKTRAGEGTAGGAGGEPCYRMVRVGLIEA